MPNVNSKLTSRLQLPWIWRHWTPVRQRLAWQERKGNTSVTVFLRRITAVKSMFR